MEGRYLLGLEPAERILSFIGRQTDTVIDPEILRQRVASAASKRAARQERPASPTFEPLPESAREHAKRVLARPLFRKLFGSDEAVLGIVDLTTAVTIQPHVNFTFAERSLPPDISDEELLDLCLPTVPKAVEVWGGVTQNEDLACTICTRDLNLLVSDAKFETEQGMRVTFSLNRTAVFSHAVEVNGTVYLKDGTHRAVGLLARGITKMPCVVIPHARESRVPSHLPPEVLFGPSKPLVADFLDPDLYLAHDWEERVKFIRIRVDEFVAPRSD